MKLTAPQSRILSGFISRPRRKSHPDYWLPSDTRPIKTLLSMGLIRYEMGCYRDDYYVLTHAGESVVKSMRLTP